MRSVITLTMPEPSFEGAYYGGKKPNPRVEITEDKMLFKRPFGGTLQFDNPTINEDMLNQLVRSDTSPSYTLILEHIVIPKGKRLPKSKRLKKKYFKKHGYPVTTKFENIELEIN